MSYCNSVVEKSTTQFSADFSVDLIGDVKKQLSQNGRS